MADVLARLQEAVASYPTWLVIAVVVVGLAVTFWLLGKMFKLVLWLAVVVAVAGVLWYGLEFLHQTINRPGEADVQSGH